MWPYVVKFHAKAQSSQRLCVSVFVLCVLSATLSQRLQVLVYASPFASYCSFCDETSCVCFSQRRGGAEVLPVLYVFLCVLRLRFRRDCGCYFRASPYVFLCDLMWFKFHAKAQSPQRLCVSVFVLCVLSATLSQGLCVLVYASPFVIFCSFCGETSCVCFSQRRWGAEVLPVLYVFCVFWGFAFAEAVSVSFRLRLMCSYVTLCGLNFTQRRKVRKGCGFPVFILCVFERYAFAKAAGVSLRFAFCFLLFLLWCNTLVCI